MELPENYARTGLVWHSFFESLDGWSVNENWLFLLFVMFRPDGQCMVTTHQSAMTIK